MNRRRFLLAIGLLVVAPVLGVDEAVTEAASYPEPGDLEPTLPEPVTPLTIDVASNHGFFVGDDLAITDLETGFREVFVITAIDVGRGTLTGYRTDAG